MIHEKHTGYYEILEALRDTDGCAFCALELRDTRRYLDSILDENVNNSEVRRTLKKSHGYCRRHAQFLLELGDGLGASIIYRDQLNQFSEFLGELKEPAGSFRPRHIPEAWNDEIRCPACISQTRSRNRHTATLFKWFEEPDMRKAFENSPGICAPHLLRILKHAKSPVREQILEIQQRQVAALAEELDVYIQKNNYRRREKGFGKEGNAWRRAVHMMSGEPGVF